MHHNLEIITCDPLMQQTIFTYLYQNRWIGPPDYTMG